MLTHNTAYRVTQHNARFLAFMTGLPIETFACNLGWYAYFSETAEKLWSVIPASEVDPERCFVEDDAWHHTWQTQ